MADRRKPVTKKPDEILDSVFTGHDEAALNGSAKAKQYLLDYLDKYNSIPNAVKFFIYDLLAEDAYQCDDHALCREAVARAEQYLPQARSESAYRFGKYLNNIRFVERGIAVMAEAGEFDRALALCDLAIGIGLGKVYAAKKASIERNL